MVKVDPNKLTTIAVSRENYLALKRLRIGRKVSFNDVITGMLNGKINVNAAASHLATVGTALRNLENG